jgi:lipoprotein-anchoring transpeptidase ErfK/SrfK
VSRTRIVRNVLVSFLGLMLLSVFALPAPALASVDDGSEAASAGRRIVVRLSQQMLYAYQGNTLVFSAAVNARGTRRGTFRVQTKMSLAGSIYRGWRLPYWMGIYYVGRVENGIHGPAVIRGRGGVTTSLGCIVLRSNANAAWLYSWAPRGTPVTVR